MNYKTKMHYLLIGHENTPDKLKAKIYTFDVTNRWEISETSDTFLYLKVSIDIPHLL